MPDFKVRNVVQWLTVQHPSQSRQRFFGTYADGPLAERGAPAKLAEINCPRVEVVYSTWRDDGTATAFMFNKGLKQLQEWAWLHSRSSRESNLGMLQPAERSPNVSSFMDPSSVAEFPEEERQRNQGTRPRGD